MFTFIGLTLVFAGMTSSLGIPNAVRMLRKNWPRRRSVLPLIVSVTMTVWFWFAGFWALLSNATVGI